MKIAISMFILFRVLGSQISCHLSGFGGQALLHFYPLRFSVDLVRLDHSELSLYSLHQAKRRPLILLIDHDGIFSYITIGCTSHWEHKVIAFHRDIMSDMVARSVVETHEPEIVPVTVKQQERPVLLLLCHVASWTSRTTGVGRCAGGREKENFHVGTQPAQRCTKLSCH